MIFQFELYTTQILCCRKRILKRNEPEQGAHDRMYNTAQLIGRGFQDEQIGLNLLGQVGRNRTAQRSSENYVFHTRHIVCSPLPHSIGIGIQTPFGRLPSRFAVTAVIGYQYMVVV